MKGTFGEKLVYLMDMRQLSYRALTDQLGINKDQFTRWKQGAARPQWSNVLKLADFFRVDPHSLADPGLDLRFMAPEIIPDREECEPDEQKEPITYTAGYLSSLEEELINQFRSLSTLDQMDVIRYLLNLRDQRAEK